MPPQCLSVSRSRGLSQSGALHLSVGLSLSFRTCLSVFSHPLPLRAFSPKSLLLFTLLSVLSLSLSLSIFSLSKASFSLLRPCTHPPFLSPFLPFSLPPTLGLCLSLPICLSSPSLDDSVPVSSFLLLSHSDPPILSLTPPPICPPVSWFLSLCLCLCPLLSLDISLCVCLSPTSFCYQPLPPPNFSLPHFCFTVSGFLSFRFSLSLSVSLPPSLGLSLSFSSASFCHPDPAPQSFPSPHLLSVAPPSSAAPLPPPSSLPLSSSSSALYPATREPNCLLTFFFSSRPPLPWGPSSELPLSIPSHLNTLNPHPPPHLHPPNQVGRLGPSLLGEGEQ
ncbi:synaptic defective enhancer 1-like [Mustela lutreola]|uniref:synaptic defective enhancer 1-like n=1 Tax=Mustela lutreola TaxID=9666 RepID=UPI0027972834|nr:synaptic defective enhancer 1-like [Mustela lutreola]